MKSASLSGVIFTGVVIMAIPVFAQDEALRVDFDRGADAANLLKEARVRAGQDSQGVAVMRLVEMRDSGEHIVRSESRAGGKQAQAEFMPKDRFFWKLTCEGQNPKPWNVAVSYKVDHKAGGHAHAPARPLPLLSGDGGTLPNPVNGRNIPGNTPFTVLIEAPAYATNLSFTAQFSGWCGGTAAVDVDITVAANGLIQLEEVFAEPYLRLKTPSANHPKSYFGTTDTVIKINQIAKEYNDAFPKAPAITLTDMSLPWGGRFYFPTPSEGCWIEGDSHFYHRYGRQIDVRIWSIPESNRDCLEEIACKYFAEAIVHGAPGVNTHPRRADIPFYSSVSSEEENRLDNKEPHYHLNFSLATDPPVNPADQPKGNKCAVSPAAKSACPRPTSRD